MFVQVTLLGTAGLTPLSQELQLQQNHAAYAIAEPTYYVSAPNSGSTLGSYDALYQPNLLNLTGSVEQLVTPNAVIVGNQQVLLQSVASSQPGMNEPLGSQAWQLQAALEMQRAIEARYGNLNLLLQLCKPCIAN